MDTTNGTETSSHKKEKKKKKALSNIKKDSEKYKRQRKLANNRNKKWRNKLSEEEIEEQKRKDRERYHRKKQQNVIKGIADLSEREVRKKRKEWKRNSKNYRMRKNALENHLKLTPPVSPVEPTVVLPVESSQKKRGRKRVKKDKAKVYRDNEDLKRKCNILKTRLERYKKRLQRLNKGTENSPSPKKQVKRLITGHTVSPEIRKQLLFGYAVKKQLENRIKNVPAGSKTQQIISKVVGSNVLRKYRVQGILKKVVPYTLNKKASSEALTYDRKKRTYFMTPEAKQIVRHFYEDDRHSKMCPGKKDFIKKNGKKKQKRLLLDSLKNLYVQFRKENTLKISFRTFCREKPFWVGKPRLADRNTCACEKHSNIDFLRSKLYQCNVVTAKNSKELLEQTTCATTDNDECMLGTCPMCKEKEIPTTIETDSLIKYNQWKTVKEKRNIKGVEKEIKKMAKQTYIGKVSEVITLLQSKMTSFKTHVFIMKKQAENLKRNIEELKEDEILLHIDFSQNYVAKLSEEIQSMHFGASKKQISLHTGILYTNNKVEVKKQCFATVSDNLEHRAYAVWAHLKPVLEKTAVLHGKTKKVYFWSDGPTSQYRNKSNIHFMREFVPTYFTHVETVCWNFTESGHGKGPMDGVGGTLKRIADEIVCHGKDISSASDLEKLNGQFPKVDIIEISAEDIGEFKYSATNAEAVKNIMKAHQIVWDVKSCQQDVRTVSCLNCPQQCMHWSIGHVHIKNSSAIKCSEEYSHTNQDVHDQCIDEDDADVNGTEHIDQNEQDLYTDFETPDDISGLPPIEDVQAGMFVLVTLQRKNASAGRFVAVCESAIDDNGDAVVMFLKSVGDSKKCYKTVDNDISYVHFTDLVSILPFPNLLVKGDRVFYEFEDPVDICEI